METRKFTRIEGDERTPELPECIITQEILPRLPVKSLLKFKCVSKSWCSSIGSKSFMKAHLKNSIKNSRFTQRLMFLDDVFQQCSLHSLFDIPFTEPITYDIDPGIDWKHELICFAGCCNGLVCIILNWEEFILWNPTTKKSKKLPTLYNQKIQVEYGSIVKYGFGFDELDDDYKVFGMVIASGEPIRGNGIVYSLKTNLWTVIEETDVYPFDDPFDDGLLGLLCMGMGMHVSGKLHWCEMKGYPKYIVSFDLNSHVFGVVELPNYPTGFYETYNCVGVLGGCLSAHFLRPDRGLDVWLMKDYGVKESWDKVVTIPYCDHPCTSDQIPIPLAIGPNGEILLNYESYFMIYNPESNMFRDPDLPDHDIVSPGIYIESLASVAPDTEQET